MRGSRIFLLSLWLSTAAGLPAQAETIRILAAASLKNALDEAAATFKKTQNDDINISYGASFTLVRQIIAGAPADIVICADEASMDEGQAKGIIDPASRMDLLGNHLVLIAPATAMARQVALTPSEITAVLGDGKIAMGELQSVPAGIYGKAALTKLNLWDSVKDHIAMSDNVRAALAFVSHGEAKLGIVYATDAQAEPAVKILATFPDDSHEPIHYPVALSARSTAHASKFLDFLKSPAAVGIFEKQGFEVLPH